MFLGTNTNQKKERIPEDYSIFSKLDILKTNKNPINCTTGFRKKKLVLSSRYKICLKFDICVLEVINKEKNIFEMHEIWT